MQQAASMTESVSEEIVSTAVRAAEEAGRLLKEYFSGVEFEVRSKAPADLVTTADVAAERRIAEVIRSVFPDHAILGEEENSGDLSAEYLWVVDPLDGTTNFAHGIPHFAVSIACLHRGRAIVGVVWNPIRGDWYQATRGGGAFHNGRRMQVGRQSQLSEVLIATGFYYDRGAMMEATLAAIGDVFRQNIHGIRRFGTASLDLAQVAGGQFGGFFEYMLSPWDYAAGGLLVEEAGGRISTCQGSSLPLSKSSLLATNGLLHDELLAIVRRHWNS
jgi:myo-inositol-1(or 4)-monophosphatase